MADSSGGPWNFCTSLESCWLPTVAIHAIELAARASAGAPVVGRSHNDRQLTIAWAVAIHPTRFNVHQPARARKDWPTVAHADSDLGRLWRRHTDLESAA